MTIIHATEMPDRQFAPAVMVAPLSLREAIKFAAVDSMPRGFDGAAYRDPDRRPVLSAVPWADAEAEAAWLAIEDWQVAQIEERVGHDGVVGRAAEQTIKLATLRALSRDGKSAAVRAEDVAWAWSIVQHSIDCLDKGVSEYMAGSEFEGLCKAIKTALRRATDGAMARSVLLRAKGISKADGRQVTAALDRLVETGEITRSGSAISLASPAALAA